MDNLARRPGNQQSQVVSSEAEKLILVDAEDRDIGFESKAACHDGDGILHRAFSLFILNDAGDLLLQQRSPSKRLWGGYWSNSCCSHPRAGETMDQAVQRRLQEELGIRCPLKFLYKFQYQASFGDAGSENELCWVYVGRSDQAPATNINEISAVRYIALDDLDRELAEQPDQFTPWFKLEWERLRSDFADELA